MIRTLKYKPSTESRKESDMRIALAMGILGLMVGTAGYCEINNLHLVDSNPQGFALYRMGNLDKEGIKELCKLGVEEMIVLSGDAAEQEIKYQDQCPGLKVVFNTAQDVKIPLSASFLSFFDNWVTEAQSTGKKVGFRCNCGCHRTGRLAAYYQMKYQGIDADAAIEIMKELGKYMFFFKELTPQVRDLRDYIDGVECQQKEKYCVLRKELYHRKYAKY